MDSDRTPTHPRYARQAVLPEIGAAGQARLAAARVLVVGAGGLGCPVLSYLAGAGVGHLRIVDGDTVDESNLHRQVLYRQADQGRPKAVAAAEAVRALNPLIGAEAVVATLHRDNALDLARDVDVIVDGTDSFEAKYLLSDVAVLVDRPLVYGSVLGVEGQAAVLGGRAGPCYRCLYPERPRGHVPNCAEAGVIGAVAGLVGMIQALETIKRLVDPDGHALQGLDGRLLAVDGRHGLQTDMLAIPRRAGCLACGQAEGPDLAALHPPPTVPVREVTVADLEALAPVTLVDVREPAETALGTIEGAVLWPLSQLIQAPDRMPEGVAAGRAVVVFCASGVRSRRAAQALALYLGQPPLSLAGGVQAWCQTPR